MDSIENGKNTLQQKVFTSCESAVVSKYKDAIIVVLTIFIILTILGINTCDFISRWFRFIYEILSSILYDILKLFGYSVGSAVNSSSDVIANLAKDGIDILNGTVNNASNVVVGVIESDENFAAGIDENFANMSDETRLDMSFDTTLNKSSMRHTVKPPEPINEPNTSEWCLIEENKTSRNCELYTRYK